MDYEIQAGQGTAAVKGLVTTLDSSGNPVKSHQINAVFRSGDPATPLYSCTYQVNDLPLPTAAFNASWGAVDFQDVFDGTVKFTVMRYTANLIPRPEIAGNETIKNQLIQYGDAVVFNHFRRMRGGATESQLAALHVMLNDND